MANGDDEGPFPKPTTANRPFQHLLLINLYLKVLTFFEIDSVIFGFLKISKRNNQLFDSNLKILQQKLQNAK